MIKKKIYKKTNTLKLIILLTTILILLITLSLISLNTNKKCDKELKEFCESQFLTYEGNGKCTINLIGNYKQTFNWICVGKNNYRMHQTFVEQINSTG